MGNKEKAKGLPYFGYLPLFNINSDLNCSSLQVRGLVLKVLVHFLLSHYRAVSPVLVIDTG